MQCRSWCALVLLCAACASEQDDAAEEGRHSDTGVRSESDAARSPSDAGGRARSDAGASSRADAGRDARVDAASADPSVETGAGAGAGMDAADALKELERYLAAPRADRAPLAEQAFAGVALTKEDTASASELLWNDFAASVREERKGEVGASESTARTVSVGRLSMRYYLARRGGEPEGGRSLFISMHGGGNAGASTNDSQWQNQISLVDGYNPKDAIWIAPRAPIDDWNMWFIEGIDALFERLITDMIVFEGVNPNKVYINGYSAGGDGVYQLGPRMAERWAGAGMSAGHPNSASPLNLRNLAFAIHVGGADTSFDRNLKAMEWGMRLDMLAAADPEGYPHQWQVHAGLPHWMNLEDVVSIPFLQSHVRDPIPRAIVWEQAEVTRPHFYWLAVAGANLRQGTEVRASYDAEGVQIELAKGVRALQVRLSDAMLDLDQPVRITYADQELFFATAPRTIATLARTLEEREDPSMLFSAEVTVELP